MRHPARNFITGIAAGMIAGAAVSMMLQPMQKKKMQTVRKRANRALRSFGGVIDKAQDFIG